MCSFPSHVFQSGWLRFEPMPVHVHISMSILKSFFFFFWKLLAWKTQPLTRHLHLSTITNLTSLHWSDLLLTLPNPFLFTGPHNKHPVYSSTDSSLITTNPHHSHGFLIKTCQPYLWNTSQPTTSLPSLSQPYLAPPLDPCSRLLPATWSLFLLFATR